MNGGERLIALKSCCSMVKCYTGHLTRDINSKSSANAQNVYAASLVPAIGTSLLVSSLVKATAG